MRRDAASRDRSRIALSILGQLLAEISAVRTAHRFPLISSYTVHNFHNSGVRTAYRLSRAVLKSGLMMADS
jgi:hypothetical protein